MNNFFPWITACIKKAVRPDEWGQQHLRAHQTINQILAKPLSFEDAVHDMMQALCGTFAWDMGNLWIPSSEDDSLRYGGGWHGESPVFKDFKEQSSVFPLNKTTDLFGTSWPSRKPVWVDLRSESAHPRTSRALKAGFHSVATVPATTMGKTWGILEFLSTQSRPPHPHHLSILASFSVLFAQLIDTYQNVAKVHQSEILLQSVIEHMPLAILLKEAGHLRCIRLNKVAEDLLGHSQNELLGKNDYDFLPREQADFFMNWERDVLKGRKIVDIPEDPIETANGKRILHTQKIPIPNIEGKPGYLLNISEDITERKQMESVLAQAREAVVDAERLKAQFMANMSHEIRTPMNAIMGMTQILRETSLSSQQKECVGILHQASESLMQVINQILDFANLQSGKCRLETVPFDLRETFESVVEMLSHQAQAKGLELACSIPSDVPTRFQGDANRLRQILTNLVGNALKFTEHGEVVVRTEKLKQSTDRILLRVTVQDTGPGISQVDQQRLFQAFTQADMSSTRSYGGTGLGLAVSKKFIELMGGDIGVDSQTGKGSIFWFTVQLKPQDENVPTTPPVREILAGKRVLIVDDNETNRKIVQHQITTWGMRSDCVSNGADALTLLLRATTAGDPYQIALLDMWMPGMDGLTLARTIKNDPPLQKIKTVIMTSLAQRPEDTELREAGVHLFLMKPVRQSHLLDCLILLCQPSRIPEPEVSPRSLLVEPTTSPAATRSIALRSTRILLAEDNLTNQQVARILFGKLGYTTDIVANGRQAVEAATSGDYDLIFMDCQMPEIDGYAATTRIRGYEGEGRRIPIIAMTANTLQGDQEKCLAVGMDDYISKPITLDRLAAVLTKWAAPVDMEILGQLRDEGDHHFLDEVISQYLKEIPPHMKALREAVLNVDADAVRQEAHLIKGSSSNFNARKLVKLCARLEVLGRSGSLAGTTDLMHALEEEFTHVQKILKSEQKHTAHP